MLKIRALTLIVAISLVAVAPLGRATMIVYDPANHVTGTLQLQQQITSATQNVASVLKQVDQYAEQVRQYETQLMQYAQQVKDATLPVTQVWSQAQRTWAT
jgi:conjugal transfer/entry exclusion protein